MKVSLRSTYRQILRDNPSPNPNLLKCLISKFLNPGYSVLFTFRIGQLYYHSGHRLFKIWSSRKRMKLVFKRNCDISFLAKLGDSLKFPHPIGIVIGAGVVIGDNVTIFQHVTLGSDGRSEEEMKYPIIEDNVVIFADAIILGNVRVGQNSVIAAKTLVNIDVPPNSIAVGTPCRIIKKDS